MKGLVALVALGALAFGGAFGWARHDLASRVSALGNRLGEELKIERSGRVPSEDAIRATVEEAAAALGLEASDIEIKLERSTEGATRVGKAVVGRLNEAVPGRADQPAEDRPRFELRSTRIDVQARVQGKKWLWSVDRPFSTWVVLHGGF